MLPKKLFRYKVYFIKTQWVRLRSTIMSQDDIIGFFCTFLTACSTAPSLLYQICPCVLAPVFLQSGMSKERPMKNDKPAQQVLTHAAQ